MRELIIIGMKGCNISGCGAVRGDGHLVVNSGGGLYRREADNMLLAFALAGKPH